LDRNKLLGGEKTAKKSVKKVVVEPFGNEGYAKPVRLLAEMSDAK